MKTMYINPNEFEDTLPGREKARRHLNTWTKERLVNQLLMAVEDGRSVHPKTPYPLHDSTPGAMIKKWAEKFDKDNKRRRRR